MDKDTKARAAAASSDGGTSTPAPNSSPAKPFTRRFPRFVIDVRLQVKVLQAGELRSGWGRSGEMGEEGMGATPTASLPPGEIVTLQLPLPLTPHPIKLRPIPPSRHGLRHGFELLTFNANQS